MSTVLKGYSLSQYVEEEIRTGVKHEYYRGEVFAMVGGTPRHALIATNFLRESSMALKERLVYLTTVTCESRSKNLTIYLSRCIDRLWRIAVGCRCTYCCFQSNRAAGSLIGLDGKVMIVARSRLIIDVFLR